MPSKTLEQDEYFALALVELAMTGLDDFAGLQAAYDTTSYALVMIFSAMEEEAAPCPRL